MEVGKACRIIKAEIKCKRIDYVIDCDPSDCNNCQWNNESGTTGEFVEALEMALQALQDKFIEDMQEND